MSALLTVDLDVFADNVRHVMRTVHPADLMLVVKDDAYGHGLGPIARRAWSEGVTWFGAFDVPTGIEVRAELGPQPRVFAFLAASAVDVAAAVDADLDIGIGDAALLDEVADAAVRAGARARVHLKIDTGLHRNGIRPEDWPAVVARAVQLAAGGAIDVVGVWSHISEASDEDDDRARAVFDTAVAHAGEAGLTPGLRHLAASAASFGRPDFRCDMVRVGAYCYGIRPAGGPGEGELGVRPIARLTASVIAVEDGTTTASIGALDGLPSTLAGRMSVGTPAGLRPVLSIDAATTVIASWPGASIGDIVTVYGPGESGESTATSLAEAIGTIGEEIALRVSPLVRREYRGG